MKWQHWNWLNDFILPVALSLMRVSVLWLWLWWGSYFLMPSHTGPFLSAGEMTAVLLGSLFLVRWSGQRIRPLLRARIVVALAGLLTIFWLLWDRFYQANYALLDGRWLQLWTEEIFIWPNEVPPPFLLFLILTYLWLRGIWDGSTNLRHENAIATFIGGSISLVLLFPATLLINQPFPPQTSAIIFIFFTMALLSLSLSSLKTGRYLDGETAVTELPLNDYWLSSSLVIIAALIFVAIIINLIIAPDSFYQLLNWSMQALADILIIVIKLISLLLYPVLLLLSWLIGPLLNRAFSLRRMELEAGQGDDALLDPTAISENVEPFIQQLPQEIRWLILLLMLLLLASFFGLLMRRLRDDGRGGIPETRQSIFSLDLLRRQLAQLRPAWLGAAATLRFGDLAHEVENRRTIRQRYQALLALAHQKGQSRAKGQTPLEYSHDLRQQFGKQTEAVGTMTQHYLYARYAEQPPSVAQVQATETAWQALQSDAPEG